MSLNDPRWGDRDDESGEEARRREPRAGRSPQGEGRPISRKCGVSSTSGSRCSLAVAVADALPALTDVNRGAASKWGAESSCSSPSCSRCGCSPASTRSMPTSGRWCCASVATSRRPNLACAGVCPIPSSVTRSSISPACARWRSATAARTATRCCANRSCSPTTRTSSPSSSRCNTCSNLPKTISSATARPTRASSRPPKAPCARSSANPRWTTSSTKGARTSPCARRS